MAFKLMALNTGLTVCAVAMNSLLGAAVRFTDCPWSPRRQGFWIGIGTGGG